jgi:chromate transporter
MVSPAAPPAAPQVVPFSEAFRFWLKLGFISFGGPAGQIAIMHSELVERRRWISERRFLHALNYCMLLPGPEAQQLATYIGWLLHRSWGGVVAGALFVLPSLCILVMLSWVYLRFGDVPLVAGIFYGLKPAVTAVVLHAAHRIGTRALKNGWMWGIAAASFLAIFALNVPFPAIVVAAALAGHFGARRWPDVFALGGGHGPGSAGGGPALIDDHTPTPAHALFSRRRLATVLAIGAGLWLAGMALLVATTGLQGTLTQMGWFFTKAALLTFGGAYAVLPYVVQGAVDTHHWLSGLQMIDGLALGETTPGPLVEATHGKLGFTAPLSAITAAARACVGGLQPACWLRRMAWYAPVPRLSTVSVGSTSPGWNSLASARRWYTGAKSIFASCSRSSRSSSTK